VKTHAKAHAAEVVRISNRNNQSPLAVAAPSCETLEYTELRDFLRRLAGLRAIFTPHLHLAITAYSQRIPTFSLYVREKTKRFCDRIGQPGRAQDLSVAKPADFKRFIAAAQSAMRTDQDEETLQRLQGQASSVLAFLNQERTRGRVTYPVGPKFTVTSARFATPVRQLKSIRS